MIQIINGIKIKTSTIDEAINLIFKKKKRYRELFLINSLTMNMIERLLLINELIIQKALEDLNVLKIEQKPINNSNNFILFNLKIQSKQFSSSLLVAVSVSSL